MYFVNKYIIIEMAHRLPNYTGACRNIHGHSWKITAQFGCEQLIKSGPDQGMACDFSELKTALTECVHRQFDHALTLWNKDPLLPLMEENEDIIGRLKIMVTLEPPTSEYLAMVWFKSISNFKLSVNDVKLISITVNETCTSEACYMPHVVIDNGAE